MREYRQFYRRKLPHIHSPGAILFITFRLAGTIPKAVLTQWRRERDFFDSQISRESSVVRSSIDTLSDKRLEFARHWFQEFERILDKAESGPMWLADASVARMLFDSLVFRDGREYRLIAFCIMSNHVHVVFRTLLDERGLTEVRGERTRTFESDLPTVPMIMKSLKGYTARQANGLLGRTGKFWDEEFYDREIRNENELARTIEYVKNNPVKAGLVRDWKDWKWTWVRSTTDC